MQIGGIIRKYRKERALTQEEMARRLGVTAPAVNKWENGNSMPDIGLLAPIARLLNISLDTLLNYRECLSGEEINNIICELDEKMEKEPYDEVFQWAKKLLEKYPNCDQLIWQVAVVLNARLMIMGAPEPEKYEAYILECYRRVLGSSEETVRTSAADSLFSFYMRREQYEEAEKCLDYFSMQNPERKRKQAFIYSKTHRKEEALKAYEELLFSSYQMSYMLFGGILGLALEDHDMEKAHYIVDKLEGLGKVFSMSRYNEMALRLELAVLEQDADAAFRIMRELLDNVDHMMDYCDSPLYSHMEFRKGEDFGRKMAENLKKAFREEEDFDFMKEDPRWKELLGE